MKEKEDNKIKQRAGVLNDTCISLQARFAYLALTNRLSPSEMMSVAATFSFTLISNISEHFNIDKSKLFECFLDVMRECAKEDK